MSVVALDPGNSTGWVFRNDVGQLTGGTIGESHVLLFDLLTSLRPNIVVYETFQMYPGKAQKLIWNTFYPCEVIGVIKLYAYGNGCKLVGLQPSVKKYALTASEEDLWKRIPQLYPDATPTEHFRDAIRLLRYYERNMKN